MRYLVLILALCGLAACDDAPVASSSSNGPEDRLARKVIRLVAASPSLSLIPQECPLAIYKSQTNMPGDVADCTKNPRACVAQCEAGNRKACFDVAQVIEASHSKDDNLATYPLYMAGCARGDGNACVNAGATIKNTAWTGGPPANAATAQCQFTTFKRMCDDKRPWGCYMTAQEYRRTDGYRGKSDKNYERFMRRACAISSTSGACSSRFQ